MKSLNTPPEIVAELLMSRTANPRDTFVLVEGKTDKALWTEYKAKTCSLFPPIGKEKSIKVLEIVERRTQLQGVVAIVDPDYWLLEQEDVPDLQNLLFNDMPDMELMLLTSPALVKVLRHTITTIDMEKIHLLSERLIEKSIKIGVQYGYFRWIDYLHREYNLSFNNVVFDDVIDDLLNLNIELVAEKLVVNSTKITANQLLAQVEELSTKQGQTIMLCRGHDVLSIIANLLPVIARKYFEHNISDKVKIQTKSNELSRTLRMSYEFAYLTRTEIYAKIRTWESNNSPFKILIESEGH